MRAMHPKSPAERRWGMHRASIFAAKGALSPSEAPNHARRTNHAALRWLLPLRRVSCPGNRIAGSPFNGGPCPGVPAPSEPQRRTPLGISLKEGEMRAASRFNKCSTRFAVCYRTRICFEYQSVPFWNKMEKWAHRACLLLFDSRCFRTNHTKNFVA